MASDRDRISFLLETRVRALTCASDSCFEDHLALIDLQRLFFLRPRHLRRIRETEEFLRRFASSLSVPTYDHRAWFVYESVCKYACCAMVDELPRDQRFASLLETSKQLGDSSVLQDALIEADHPLGVMLSVDGHLRARVRSILNGALRLAQTPRDIDRRHEVVSDELEDIRIALARRGLSSPTWNRNNSSTG